MKKLLLIMMVFCCGILLVGCNKENTKEEKDTNNTEEKETVKNKVVVDGDTVTIDGAIVKDLDVIAVQNIFNFSIIFDNSNNKEVKVDCSKISIKKGNKTYKLAYPDVKTISKDQSYTQYGLPIQDSESIKVGDEFEVYFGKTKIGTATAIDR